MARRYDEDALTKSILEYKEKRDRIVKIIDGYTREMESDSYFGSNPGVEVDDYEDIADEIMIAFGI